MASRGLPSEEIYPILARIMDSFSISVLSNAFYIGKTLKGFQKILNLLRCDMVTSFYHYNDVMDRPACGRRAAVRFLSFPQTGMGM